MKSYYLGILFITCCTCTLSKRPRRFPDYETQATNDWNWVSKDQLADAQTSQVNWPRSGTGGSIKGKGDSNPNRDGAWGTNNWSTKGSRDEDFDMGWNTQPQGNNKGSAYPDGGDDQGGDLETILRGVPGMDFPNFVDIPNTDFDCSSMPSQGYYGDVESGCQVFHICQPGNRKDSFLCPVGTIFNQKYFVCDWWFNVNCSDTESYYELNNEVYKDPVAVTEAVPVTTEKSMPWNPQDTDRKKSTKSWGNQPSTGKQNPRWKDTPTRRGSKSSDSVSTSREVSNAWSRSDVQKEVTLTWGASSPGTFVSSATSSNSIVPTTKPVWYDIEGQTAKDQSNGMSKRTGLAQTPAPFGTRMRKTNSWTAREEHNYGISNVKGGNVGATTENMRMKGVKNDDPTSAAKGWQENDDGTDMFKTDGGITVTNNVDHDYSTTKSWLKGEDIPETSIHPTDIKGVWEQQITKVKEPESSMNPSGIKAVWKEQSTKRMDPETSVNLSGIKGVWEQQSTKRMDPETSMNPSGIKGVWEQQSTKRMDPETSMNLNGKKGVWKQQSTKGMHPETSMKPSGIKGVWELQTTKKIDVGTSVNPEEIKGTWKQQTPRQPDQDSLITVQNKGADTKSTQNERNFQSFSSQKNQWNQRRTFRDIQSSTAANRRWIQNKSRKRKALGNLNSNNIHRDQNWK